MELEQIVFVSATVKGADKVCLAGSSPGVSEASIKQTYHWIPHRWELAQRHSEASCFFPVNEQYFGLSRSVRGAPDALGRGEKQLVTSVLLIDRKQLQAFEGNGASLSMIARSHGALALPRRLGEDLQAVELPDWTAFQPIVRQIEARQREVEMVVRAIGIHRRVAIVGLDNPLDYLGRYLSLLDEGMRLETAWAIGLDVAPSRPFDLQFFCGMDSEVQKELTQLQVRTISLESIAA